MDAKIVQIKRTSEDDTRWNKLLNSAANVSYMSMLPYEYSKERNGRLIETFIYSANDVDYAGIHYSLKESALNLIAVSDVKSGILFKGNPDPDLFRVLLDHYLIWAKQHNVSFARFNPLLPKNIDGKEIASSKKIEEIFLEKGFSIISKPKHTYWIDLTLSEDEILKRMKRQTRYDVKQGSKDGFAIKQYHEPDEETIEKFIKFYTDLGNKKGFNILSKVKIREELNTLLSAGLATLFTAEYNGIIVNISIASNIGKAQYLYGALNPEFKKLKGCPAPGPIVQWDMIKAMKKRGLSIYDMGFCPGPVPNPEHPKYTIWRFKYGFGGYPVEFLPLYGRALKPIRGKFFSYILKA